MADGRTSSVLLTHQEVTHNSNQFSPPGKPASCLAVHIHDLAMNQPFAAVDQQAQDHRDVALLCKMIFFRCCGQSLALSRDSIADPGDQSSTRS